MSNKNGTESSPEALSALSAFVLGALSKCIATCLTYPAVRYFYINLYSAMTFPLHDFIIQIPHEKWCHFCSCTLNSLTMLNDELFLKFWLCRCKVMIQSAETDEDIEGEAQEKSKKTVKGALSAIWKREGLLGFYKGLQAQILKTVLSSALLLMVKEKISKATWVLLLAIQRYLLITRARLKSS